MEKLCQDDVACFLIVAIDEAEQRLRRYSMSEANRCPGTGGYHTASVAIARVPFVSEYDGLGNDRHPHDDPLWPVKCASCDYQFSPQDDYQNYIERLFRAEDGREFTERDAPVGAMRVWWYEGITSSAQCLERGDKEHLKVKLPDGTWWDIDAPASKDYREGGNGWTREGNPPLVTANPSILTGHYHGWLRNGQLEEV